MNRRDFIVFSTAAALLPMLANANAVPYTPGLVKNELAAGKTVFLDFAATWCVTCKAQERIITALQKQNPAYERAISFIRVDWDTYRNAAITRKLGVRNRSTLIVLKGSEEIDRKVAITGKRTIKALMDRALAAATA